MNTLFLDLAGNPGLVACVAEKEVRAAREADRRITDADLVPLLETLLQEAQWDLHGVERIACVTGPGGFTSLRVAAAFTNALAFALNVPVAGVHLSDLKNVQCAQEDLLWVHSTKKTELFVRGFGSYAKAFPEAAWMELGRLGERYPQGAPWTGELLPDHERFLSSWGAVRAEAKDAKEILPAFLGSLKYEEKNLVPWYGRKW